MESFSCMNAAKSPWESSFYCKVLGFRNRMTTMAQEWVNPNHCRGNWNKANKD